MNEAKLVVEYQITRPVELLALTASLMAIGEQYKKYAISAGHELAEANVRLLVSQIKQGSIIAELVSYSDQISWVLKHHEVLAGFATHIIDIAGWLLKYSGGLAEVNKQDIQQIGHIFDPVANDSGSQMFINVSGEAAPRIEVNYNYGQANTIQNNIRKIVDARPLGSERFEKEVLYIRQARDDVRSKAGDRGIIEKFSPDPKKLIFTDDKAKQTILDQAENIFKLAFVVDGEVSYIEGNPALYKIDRVHEAFERE